MTEQDLLAGKPFWYAKPEIVVFIRDGKRIEYTGQLEIIHQALPLKVDGDRILDKNANEFGKLGGISRTNAIDGQFFFIKTLPYGHIRIYFKELTIVPPPKPKEDA